ncbi:MAG TPA: FtsX-like permease family protein, partial [Blastocatellia bacterium]|nr:FtsX-like permease family protein [Blastocatellia bacterium]
HREYVEEAFGRPGKVGQYRVRLDSPASAARVMEEIDSMFKNSAAPTKTETEAAFAASFISMLGNVKGLISGIGLIVVFTITLIGANTMAMSARERFTEVAVMKALGFRPAMILTLMLSEAVLIALAGGVLAVIAAKVIFQFVGLGDVLALFLQNFKIGASTIAIALGGSALIGLVSGGIPAWNAARISIVDGLRRVA